MDNQQSDAIWFLLKTLLPAHRKNGTNMGCLQFLDGTEKTTNKCSDVVNHKWESNIYGKPLRIYQGG